MTIRITDDMRDVAFVVCTPADMPSPFPNNVKGLCSVCAAVVIHRPHVPPGIPLICLRCYVADQAALAADVVVTPTTVREVQLHRRRN